MCTDCLVYYPFVPRPLLPFALLIILVVGVAASGVSAHAASTTTVAKPKPPHGCESGTEQINPLTGRKQVCR
jgi:hypothetical protein